MFKVRKTPCALNKTVYDEDKESFNCQKSVSKVYHCIHDDGKRLGEICIQYVKYVLINITISHFTLISVIVF